MRIVLPGRSSPEMPAWGRGPVGSAGVGARPSVSCFARRRRVSTGPPPGCDDTSHLQASATVQAGG